MKKLFVITFTLLIVILLSCKKEVFWDSAYIVGFDPCTGGYADNIDKGYILITIDSEDTVATYNLPKDLFDFPKSYFSDYKSYCLFPDSMRYEYKIRIKYSITQKKDLIATQCTGDIYLGIFSYYVKFNQITLHSARIEK